MLGWAGVLDSEDGRDPARLEQVPRPVGLGAAEHLMYQDGDFALLKGVGAATPPLGWATARYVADVTRHRIGRWAWTLTDRDHPDHHRWSGRAHTRRKALAKAKRLLTDLERLDRRPQGVGTAPTGTGCQVATCPICGLEHPP